MFIHKKMDPKVYEEEEGKKLWVQTQVLWKSVDKKYVPLDAVE